MARKPVNFRLENDVFEAIVDLADKQNLSQSDLIGRAVRNYLYGFELRESDAQEFVDFLRGKYGDGATLLLDFDTGEVSSDGADTSNLSATIREAFDGQRREYRLVLGWKLDDSKPDHTPAELLLAKATGRKPSTFAVKVSELHGAMFDYAGTEAIQATDWPPLDL